MEEEMRENQTKLLKRLFEDLAVSGKPSLNEDRLKSLKNICRSSDFFVIELYRLCLKFLRRKHAEVRLSTFQVINEIFRRSHCFRVLVLKDFKTITELTIVYNPKAETLKPVAVAQKLRTFAIGAVQEWHEKFKEGYQTLRLGYKFLKDCKNVDFEGQAVMTEQDRQRRENERRKEEEIRDRRVSKVVMEMDEMMPDVTNIVMEFKNAFKLLIPDLTDFFIPLTSDTLLEPTPALEEREFCEWQNENIEYGSDLMREHGLTKETTVQVNLSNIHNIQETRDNELVITTIRENVEHIRKTLLPKIKQWEQSLMQYSNSQLQLIQKIIDLKSSLESILKRYSSITIIPMATGKTPAKSQQLAPLDKEYSSSDDDDDFIDVPFDDPRVINAAASESALLEEAVLSSSSNYKKNLTGRIDAQDLEEAGTSGAGASIASQKQSPSIVKKVKQNANIESFLEEKWEPVGTFKNAITDLSSIWSGNSALHEHEEDVIKPSGILGIATRPVHFEREWEPVVWECRAPLLTGALCPRKDRERCPLHGPIIPRDLLGKPVRPEDAKKDQERQDERERQHPAWQNATLLAEIRSATGVDLDIKKAKKRKRKYPNLTNLREAENTPRNRLSKKVFSKKSIRRVNKALAKLPV